VLEPLNPIGQSCAVCAVCAVCVVWKEERKDIVLLLHYRSSGYMRLLLEHQ
jgi:hypothetical protein